MRLGSLKAKKVFSKVTEKRRPNDRKLLTISRLRVREQLADSHRTVTGQGADSGRKLFD
jgi:hypothetical protein